jgi:hypothetical protein
MLALLTVGVVLAGGGGGKAAGYGDPVNGYPSAAERALVLWTNAARVDPTAFTSDYRSGGCSTDDFSRDEKTAKAPLYIDVALTEAARFHSDDMHDNGCFQHESCDGTDTWTRLARFYDEGSTLGENIAYGSADARYTVLSMWMCSHSGHRANIMSGGYNEMGGGVSGTYMTQDFAYGQLTEGQPPVRVAAEDAGAFWADWGDDDAPESITLVVNDDESAMKLQYGEASQGIYRAEMQAGACDEWFVRWETAAGDSGTFPANGAFLAGDCGEEWDKGADNAGGSGSAGDDEQVPGDTNGDGVVNSADSNPYAVQEVHMVCATGGEAGMVGALAAMVTVIGRRRRG